MDQGVEEEEDHGQDLDEARGYSDSWNSVLSLDHPDLDDSNNDRQRSLKANCGY